MGTVRGRVAEEEPQSVYMSQAECLVESLAAVLWITHTYYHWDTRAHAHTHTNKLSTYTKLAILVAILVNIISTNVI